MLLQKLGVLEVAVGEAPGTAEEHGMIEPEQERHRRGTAEEEHRAPAIARDRVDGQHRAHQQRLVLEHHRHRDQAAGRGELRRRGIALGIALGRQRIRRRRFVAGAGEGARQQHVATEGERRRLRVADEHHAVGVEHRAEAQADDQQVARHRRMRDALDVAREEKEEQRHRQLDREDAQPQRHLALGRRSQAGQAMQVCLDEQHRHAQERRPRRFRRIKMHAGRRLVVDVAPLARELIDVEHVVLDDRARGPDANVLVRVVDALEVREDVEVGQRDQQPGRVTAEQRLTHQRCPSVELHSGDTLRRLVSGIK